jgi:hypothetical protein
MNFSRNWHGIVCDPVKPRSQRVTALYDQMELLMPLLGELGIAPRTDQ